MNFNPLLFNWNGKKFRFFENVQLRCLRCESRADCQVEVYRAAKHSYRQPHSRLTERHPLYDSTICEVVEQLSKLTKFSLYMCSLFWATSSDSPNPPFTDRPLVWLLKPLWVRGFGV